MFIDGFAGPGEYTGGEPGSPIIAVNEAINHKANLSECELVYFFVERNEERYEYLRGLLDEIEKPANIRCQAVHGEFATVLAGILGDLDAEGANLAPAFVMIDPFGFAAMPYELIARVAEYPRSEFLISFMYESIVRWTKLPNLEATYDRLFGCDDWRKADGIEDAKEKKKFLIDLYVRQLKAAGMEFVQQFEMFDDGNRTEYFLIFATHSKDGLKAMKAAMWKADPSGKFQFSDSAVTGQLALIKPQPDFDVLKARIVERFGGSEVTIEGIEDFVVCETLYRETHFKRQILAPMERDQELEVVKSDRKKARTFPAGTVIRFA